MEKMANFAPPCDVRRRAGGTRLRVTLSLMLVLALVFGCVGMFAGEAMALGASGDGGTGGYVYIRNVKTGMYLTFPDTTVNTTSFLQVRTYYGTPANSARQQWRVHHGQKADGSYYVVFHSKLNDNYVISATTGENAAGLRLSVYNTSSVTAQRFDIIHGAGVARIVSHASYVNTGTWRSVQVKEGHVSTPIPSGTVLNQRIPYSTPDEKAHQYWVFEDSARLLHPENAYDIAYTTRVNRSISGGGGYVNYINHLTSTASIPWTTLVSNAVQALDAKTPLNFFNYTAGAGPTLPINEGVRIYGTTLLPPNEWGKYYPSNGHIDVNITALADKSNLARQHTLTHELGHVIGLMHTPDRGNILSSGPLNYGSSFGLDDIKAIADVTPLY